MKSQYFILEVLEITSKACQAKYSFEKDYTTGKLWNELQSKIDYSGEILVAVNHTYVDMKYVLKHGDEVAFFPPVTGG